MAESGRSFLDYTSRREVQSFITEEVQTRRGFVKNSKIAVDRIVGCLHSSDIPFSVKEVFKGGSLAKGTSVRQGADIDLVLFLNDFSSVDAVAGNMENVTKQLSKALPKRKGFKVNRVTRYAVNLTMKVCTVPFDIDLLPNFDILGGDTTEKAYEEMANKHENEKGKNVDFYSSCFSEKRVDFVKRRPNNVKRLISLLKYWKKTGAQGETLDLPSYAMELIGIHVWEEGGSMPKFDIRMGFKAAMKQLANPSQMHISWNDMYPQYNKYCTRDPERPWIQDPGNPMNNVGLSRKAEAWEEAAKCAREALKAPMMHGLPNDVKARWQRKYPPK